MSRSKAADKAVAHAEANLEVIEVTDKALTPYLDGKPYDQDRLINEVQIYYRQHSETAFEVGKRLVVLKVNTPHGQFGNVLERVGLSAPYASNLMAFARTVVEAAALSNGRLDIDKLATMDHRKVLLLGEIIEEAPEELAQGTVGGRTLDEWDAMTRAELKAKIREGFKQLGDKSEEVRKLQDKVLKEQDRITQLLSATPNAVCASVSRIGQHLRDAIASFESTCVCEEELDPDHAAILDLVALRAQLRTFYDQTMALIETRFPAVIQAEVPTDLDLTHPGTTSGMAKVIDTK